MEKWKIVLMVLGVWLFGIVSIIELLVERQMSYLSQWIAILCFLIYGTKFWFED